MLRFLAGRATPGVESVSDGAYRRTVSIDGIHGWFAVSPDSSGDKLLARISISDPRAQTAIVNRIRSLFDLDADWPLIAAALSRDAGLAARIETLPGLRPPGCWQPFELAVRAILGQQVTVKGATTLAGRLATKFGAAVDAEHRLTRLFPTPEALADADLSGIGLPTARAATIRAFARAVSEGAIDFAGIGDHSQFLAELQRVPGIGPWTAQYIAMRGLRLPDAFPASDLGLLRALSLKNPRELEKRAEAWRPFRAYAVMYLWNVAGGG